MKSLYGQGSRWRPCRLLPLGVAEVPGLWGAAGGHIFLWPSLGKPGASAGWLCALTGKQGAASLCSHHLSPSLPTLGQGRNLLFLIFEKSHLPSVSGQELSSVLQDHFPVPWSLDLRKHKKIPHVHISMPFSSLYKKYRTNELFKCKKRQGNSWRKRNLLLS